MRSVSSLINLNGRKALIAGGAGHVGLAVGETLVELGATVAILDQNPTDCKRRATRLSEIGPGHASAVPCDLRDEQSARRAVSESAASMGGLDILVHCAALVGTAEIPGWAVPFQEQSVKAWEAAFQINLTSAFIMVQESQDRLSETGYGSVIFVSSIYGMVGPDLDLYSSTDMGNPAGYGAAKGGMIQLMRYLSTVLAPKIRVNSISPGGIWRDQPESFLARYTDRTPLERMATEEDLKGAIAYLSSDLSAYVTGHNLVVDGGWTAW